MSCFTVYATITLYATTTVCAAITVHVPIAVHAMIREVDATSRLMLMLEIIMITVDAVKYE